MTESASQVLQKRRDQIDEALTYLSDSSKNYSLDHTREAVASTRELTLALIDDLLLEREQLRNTIVKIATEGLPK